jgi:hypothetical protein
MNCVTCIRAAGWTLLISTLGMAADDSGKATVVAAPKSVEDTRGPAIRRPSLGFRVLYFPSKFFDTKSAQTSTTDPVASYSYTGGTNAPKMTVGIAGEYRITNRLSVGLEFRFHHVDCNQTTSILSGIRDPNSSTDDRKAITINKSTKVSYWEAPRSEERRVGKSVV